MNAREVYEEIKAIISQRHVWFMLGSQDIKLRYRRSSIGPFWITISMAITICAMGFLYGHLFNISLTNYFPYLASGIITWSLISTLVLESSAVFIDSENYIRNQDSFMSIFMMRLILRNGIVFFHNLLVFIPILLFFKLSVSLNLLFMIPGLIFIGVNAMCWGTLIGIIGTRYRDFSQIVISLVQIVFFLTPIMWMPNSLPQRLQWLVEYNPFNQFINLIRLPLLNQEIPLDSLLLVSLVTLIGFFTYSCFIGKYKHRIVFWL